MQLYVVYSLEYSFGLITSFLHSVLRNSGQTLVEEYRKIVLVF